MKFSSIVFLSSTALLAIGSNAFAVIPATSSRTTALASSVSESREQFFFVEDAPASGEIPSSLYVSQQRVVEKPKPVKKAAPNKPSGGHGDGGLFAPTVKLAKMVLGEEKLNDVRGKAIGLHSEVIRSVVDTHETELGQKALEILFRMADADKNGSIDKEELKKAVKVLGFKHLNDKQINGIFERADLDGNGTLDLEEFKAEAPKTLKTNLIKLAKSNGGELGFLA